MIEEHAVLTINGSDGAGVTGIQADIDTIRALGGVPLTAITTITMQNTLGIQEFYDLPAEVFAKQVEAVMDDMHPQAVKIGMLRSTGQLQAVCRLLAKYQPRWVVYDPVATTTRGEQLISDELKQAIIEQLLPQCNIVTTRIHAQGLVEWDIHGIRGLFAVAIATFLTMGHSQEDAIREAIAYANRQAALSQHIEGRGADLYNELLNLISRHCRQHNDVQFYADRMNVSPRYLAQVTRRMAAVTPKQLIDEQLLQQLKVALQSSDHPIKEIAFDYGFASQSHFTKFFRKQTGMTPSEFKQGLRGAGSGE